MTRFRHIVAKLATARRMRPAAAVCCLATLACGGSTGRGSQSADQQSIAEYDLARDAFQNQKLRESLDHVEKALDFDDENADAAYLGAVILLGFCARDERSSDCRYDEAEKYARQALKSNEDMRDARNTLGVVLVQQKKFDEAIGVLKPLANDI